MEILNSQTNEIAFNDYLKKESKLEHSVINQYQTLFNNTDKMVCYEEVKDYIGFKKKSSVKEMLLDPKFNFKEGTDYIIERVKIPGICKPVDEIKFTLECVKLICLMAQTYKGQEFRKYYIKMEKLFRQYMSLQIQNLITQPVPCLRKLDFDVNQYTNKEVLYLIHVKDNIYKYGITANISKRLKDHERILKYKYVVKCWDCTNRTIAKKVEDIIKKYMKINKLNSIYENQTEIFKIDNINELIIIFDKYVNNETTEWNKILIDAQLQQEKDLVQEKIKLAEKLKDLTNDKVNETRNKFFFGDIDAEINNLNKDIEQHEVVIKKMEEQYNKQRKQKDPLEDAMINKAHCKRCDSIKNRDEFDINEETDERYKQCHECKIRINELEIIKKQKEDEDNRLKQLEKEVLKLKVSNMTKEEKIEEILNGKSFCQRCSTEKENSLFGINSHTGVLFKQCLKCREVSRRKESRRRLTETRQQWIKENHEKYRKKHEEKQREERINQVQNELIVKEQDKDENKTLNEKHKEYYDKNKESIIEHKKKKRLANQTIGDPPMRFCSRCSKRKQFDQFTINSRTNDYYKQCNTCRSY